MRRALPLVLAVSVALEASAPGPARSAPPPPAAAPPHGLAAPGPPAADSIPPPSDPATDLAAAERFYANLDYDKANLIAARVSGGKGLSHADLVRALRLLSLTDAALGNEGQAREEFIELLTYAPDFQVDPNLGPRVTAPFLEARGFWRAQAEKPGIEVVATVHPNQPASLRVITRDPTHIVKSGTVGYRWGADAPYTTAPLVVSEGEGSLVDIPQRPATVLRLDYFAQALDDRGNVVLEAGNPASPKGAVIEVPKVAKAERSIFASPIFWTVAGVVVASAAITTYLLARPKTPSGATLTGAAECGSSDVMGTPAAACR
jgi:hypothetical protein